MIHLLVDVVSKNGNLLLNIPLPGDGKPDDDEIAFLDKFGGWMALQRRGDLLHPALENLRGGPDKE